MKTEELADEFGQITKREMNAVTARLICDLRDENRELRTMLAKAQALNTALEGDLAELHRENAVLIEKIRLDCANVRYLFLHHGVGH